MTKLVVLVGVYDGFPVKECARVHTFKSVVIVSV